MRRLAACSGRCSARQRGYGRRRDRTESPSDHARHARRESPRRDHELLVPLSKVPLSKVVADPKTDLTASDDGDVDMFPQG
jgi:hypothetical protein